MTRNRIFLGSVLFALAIAAAGAVYMLRGNILDPLDRGHWPFSGEYIGQTRASVVARYGPPSAEWQGHYGNPREDWAKNHEPAVSMDYKRLTGNLYLSFHQVNDEWICFSSDWMPDGWVF
jgi:hypothetical protein